MLPRKTARGEEALARLSVRNTEIPHGVGRVAREEQPKFGVYESAAAGVTKIAPRSVRRE